MNRTHRAMTVFEFMGTALLTAGAATGVLLTLGIQRFELDPSSLFYLILAIQILVVAIAAILSTVIVFFTLRYHSRIAIGAKVACLCAIIAVQFLGENETTVKTDLLSEFEWDSNCDLGYDIDYLSNRPRVTFASRLDGDVYRIKVYNARKSRTSNFLPNVDRAYYGLDAPVYEKSVTRYKTETRSEPALFIISLILSVIVIMLKSI